MEKRCINPRSVGKPLGQYSHLVQVSSKKTLYIAGQTAVNRKGQLVGKGDFRAQAEQVFANLQAILKSRGASFNDVVKLNTYVTDMANRPILNEVRKKYIRADFPASTLVGVTSLAQPDFMIEVEVIAALD